MLRHLTDDEVQLYVTEKKQCTPELVAHVHVCEECKAKTEVYQWVIKAIAQQPQPAFDFDLAGLVLQKLPPRKTTVAKDRLTTWILIFVSMISLAVLGYYFLNYQANIFEGVATILIYLVAVSGITVIAALVFDMYKKYQKEMKVLDLY